MSDESGSQRQLTAIGGPKDRCAISGGDLGRYVLVAGNFDPIPLSPPAPSPELVRARRREVYRREVFKYGRADGDVSEWTFWVHEILTNDEALARVMGGYGR